MKQITWHISIHGLVQGVGFRPLIYNLAQRYKLKGWVENGPDGLHIEVSGNEDVLQQFYQDIIDQPPKEARISQSHFSVVEFKGFDSFFVRTGSLNGECRLHIAPDFAICSSCLSELDNEFDRRYSYPFITCSACGPRYSIMNHLPYEREFTVMEDFELCPSCDQEYNDPSDRRFYAQTNSCSECGIELTLFDSNKGVVESETSAIISLVVDLWNSDKIVAVKGIGGYLLTCSADSEVAISTLRKRKQRPDKPFALMYPNIDRLESFNLSKEERQAYSGSVAPIVLLDKSDNQITAGICDDLDHVGIMLPYAPLFHVLFDQFNGPIVATSGNVSNDPIVYDDDNALDKLSAIADYILVNNRPIVTPQDDSVIKYSNYYRRPVIMRRSRGMAPSIFKDVDGLSDRRILSMGSDLKSTCAFYHRDNVYVSQYIGDLNNYETLVSYNHILDHLTGLLRFKPDVVACDAHPSYQSTMEGERISKGTSIPIIRVQHHIAHFAALLGEHGLIDSNENILGVIWDGTGWGDDDAIWGGEFFTYSNYQFDRVAHLDYFKHIAKDKMSKEPRLSALSLCSGITGLELLKSKFSDTEWGVYTKLLDREEHLNNSSIGRLFDAVASLLGLCDVQTFEGHAASLLQINAERYLRKCNYDFDENYWDDNRADGLELSGLMKSIIHDIIDEADSGIIAAKFHLTLVRWIGHIATQQRIHKIGFSGGVFQNTLLIDLIIMELGSRFELLFHEELSPNDENISFGQVIYSVIEENRPE